MPDPTHHHPAVVFICSLGHSGSTALELALTSIPGTVGIGELWLISRDLIEGRDIAGKWCQCGLQASRCPLWSEVLERVSRDQVATESTIYGHVLDVVTEIHGTDVTIIDSSKRMEALDALRMCAGDHEIRVVHLVRDVRAWSTSILKHGNLPTGRVPVPSAIVRTYPYLLTIWHSRVKKMVEFLESTGLPTFDVGYEQYATDPGRHLPQIAEFAGLTPVGEPHPGDSDADGRYHQGSADPISHMLAGNPMRTDPHRRAAITYDIRWMDSTAWLPAAMLLWPVMRYNSKVVYHAHGVHTPTS